MIIKTILNKVQKFKHFIYAKVELVDQCDKKIVEISVLPRKNSKAMCSECKMAAPLYDKLSFRRFEFAAIPG